MKKILFISLLLAVIIVSAFFSCKQKPPAPEKAIAQVLVSQVDSFASACSRLQSAAENASAGEKQLQALFLEARLAYKRFEWASEYFEPATARFVNGPPVQEVEPSGQI